MEADTAHGCLTHKQKVSVGERRKSSSASILYKNGAWLRLFLIPAPLQKGKNRSTMLPTSPKQQCEFKTTIRVPQALLRIYGPGKS